MISTFSGLHLLFYMAPLNSYQGLVKPPRNGNFPPYRMCSSRCAHRRWIYQFSVQWKQPMCCKFTRRKTGKSHLCALDLMRMILSRIRKVVIEGMACQLPSSQEVWRKPIQLFYSTLACNQAPFFCGKNNVICYSRLCRFLTKKRPKNFMMPN